MRYIVLIIFTMRFVHFADTSGTVFTPHMPSIRPQELGNILRNDEHIVIVDRVEGDTVSRVDTDVIISALSGLIINDGGGGDSNDDDDDQANETGGNEEGNHATAGDNDLFVQQRSRSSVDDARTEGSRNDDFEIRVLMPRMRHDMYGEAMVHRDFYKNIHNIVIEPV